MGPHGPYPQGAMSCANVHPLAEVDLGLPKLATGPRRLSPERRRYHPLVPIDANFRRSPL